MSRPGACWVECPCCGDFLCRYHGTPERPIHAFDCPCPAVEEWADLGLTPYLHPFPDAWRIDG